MGANISLFLIAIVAFIILGPIAFFLQVIRKLFRKESLSDYFHALACGIDQLGGSIVYSLEDWKISSIAYYDAYYLNKNVWFMNLINSLFLDKEHCKNSYLNEFKQLKTKPERS